MSTSMCCVCSADASVSLKAAVKQPCWDGYSGCPGTPSSATQPGSAVVSGLLSLSAFRIAVIGRQN